MLDADRLVRDIEAVADKLITPITKERCMATDQDKTQIGASDPAVAKQILDRIEHLSNSEICQVVRRLGVDHALSQTKAKDLPVARARSRAFTKRVKHAMTLRGIAPLPKICTAGMLPSVLYGAEFYSFSEQQIQKLEAATHQLGTIRPTKVPTKMTSLAYRAVQLPYFHARFAPIARWAREIWAFKAAGTVPVDSLQGCELAHVWRAYRKATSETTSGQNIPNVPQALIDGLNLFQ